MGDGGCSPWEGVGGGGKWSRLDLKNSVGENDSIFPEGVVRNGLHLNLKQKGKNTV